MVIKPVKRLFMMFLPLLSVDALTLYVQRIATYYLTWQSQNQKGNSVPALNFLALNVVCGTVSNAFMGRSVRCSDSRCPILL